MSEEALAVEAETEDNPVEETEVAETVEVETDENGEPVEAEPEDEEVELGDVKLRVPKDAAQKVRDGYLRQDDYTRKTTELANQRKAFEAERGGFQQATQAEMTAQADVLALDRQIADFQRVDWDAWEEQDPFAAAKGSRQLQQLRDARANAAAQYVGLARQRTHEAQQAIAKRSEETAAELAKIPGWSPAVEAQVRDHGMKEYGFTADEMADMKIDPRIARAFYRLHTLEAAAKKANKAQGIQKQQEVQPAATVRTRGAPTTAPSDNDSTDAWMKKRNRQAQVA